MKIVILKLTSIFISLFTVISVMAQSQSNEEFYVSLSNPKESGMLVVSQTNGGVHIIGYDDDKIKIHATNNNPLKDPIKNDFEKINSSITKIRVQEVNNTVTVIPEDEQLTIDLKIWVPNNFSLNLKVINNGNIIVKNINGSIETSNENGSIILNDISGSVIADALNKDIIIDFIYVFNETNMMFSNLNGNIDVTFPSFLKASLRAKTEYGNIDNTFILTNKKVRRIHQNDGQQLTGLINGGGPEMFFNTLNGNIFIRKR